MKTIDEIKIVLNNTSDSTLTIYIDVYDSTLGRKWLDALNNLIAHNYHLEKNFCFLGFINSTRSASYILSQINNTIDAINASNLGYKIDEHLSFSNTIDTTNGQLRHNKLNNLHKYFEELQGVSNSMSTFYMQADSHIKWHIRQLNLLCHEYESMIKGMQQARITPINYRPSQLMCWLNAPRFSLDESDYEAFGIEQLSRTFGGVYIGINKAIGKDYWEVFQDEGQHGKNLNNLTTTTLRPQTEAAGDFDIEWGANVGKSNRQQKQFEEFTKWLTNNELDPNDKSLTIGHPCVGQVDLVRSFGTVESKSIWVQLSDHLNVYSIQSNKFKATYEYNWADDNYMEQQVKIINDNNSN